jgi:hypothetical protein
MSFWLGFATPVAICFVFIGLFRLFVLPALDDYDRGHK